MFRKRKSLLLLILVLATTLLFTACASSDETDEETSGEEIQETNGTESGSEEEEVEWTIDIEISEDETKEFTKSDIEEVGRVDLDAKLEKKDGTVEENQWSGVELKKILEFIEVEEYNGVEIEAEDGFTVEYDKDTVESEGTILADKVDGNELDEESGPVQMVVDGQGAKMWIKQVSKIKVSN